LLGKELHPEIFRQDPNIAFELLIEEKSGGNGRPV
jgi:hypothetical protein